MWDSQDLAEACRGRPRTLQSMPMTLQSMPRTLQSMPRSAEGVAKHAQELQNKPTHLRFPQYIEALWYTTPLALQLIRQQVGGFLFDVRLLGPCRSMPRLAKDLAKHVEDVTKHAEVGSGRCQAYVGVAKQAYTSQVPTVLN